MKPIDNSQTDIHTIRAQSTIYVDCVKIITYPTFLLITWNILASTKKLLVNILGEEFEDLHLSVILYRFSKQNQTTEFLISEPNGVLRLGHIPTGTYYCEFVARNSHNVTITVKRSGVSYYLQDENNACKEYHWKTVTEDNQPWLHAYSGYTIYD